MDTFDVSLVKSLKSSRVGALGVILSRASFSVSIIAGGVLAAVVSSRADDELEVKESDLAAILTICAVDVGDCQVNFLRTKCSISQERSLTATKSQFAVVFNKTARRYQGCKVSL
jgi:hypothetical protein